MKFTKLIFNARACYSEWGKWREKCAKLESEGATQQGGRVEGQEARAGFNILEAEPESWFKYYFPHYCTTEPADFQIAATKRIIENPEHYEVRMWSRELAKTTRTMMEVLYLTFVGHPGEVGSNQWAVGSMGVKPNSKKSYVLMISNSLSNAERLLEPYRAELENNERLVADYGIKKVRGKWTKKEFSIQIGNSELGIRNLDAKNSQRTISFRALGSGQSPRGTRQGAARPDIIIFDDVDTDKSCLNPNQVKLRWNWIEDAAIGTRSVSNPTTILFCGNKISVDCCIDRATQFADHTDIVNILDKEGIPSWPQKNSPQHVERIISQKSYAASQKEYFNNPIIEGAIFKDMHFKPARSINEYTQLLCYTDPSYGDNRTNDYKATVLVGKWEDEYHVLKCFLEQTSTSRMLDWHYHLMDLLGHRSSYFFMEEGFMNDVIRKEMLEEAKKRGRQIPLIGDNRKKEDKFTRIECALEPLHRNGQLFLNEQEKYNPHMQRLVEQFRAFAPQSRAHDDGPDAVEGAIFLLSQRSRTLRPGDVYSVPRRRGDYG